jgi:hypothetical protein
MNESWVGVCVGVGRWFENVLGTVLAMIDKSTRAVEQRHKSSECATYW